MLRCAVAGGELLVVMGHDPAHLRRVLDELVFLVDPDRREGGCEADGVGVVGEPSGEHVILEVRRDLRPHADDPER